MSENAKHAVENEEVQQTEEPMAPLTRRQRVKNWIKGHKVQIGIGAGAAALTGVGLAVKKAVKDRTGIDIGEEIADVVEGVTPPEA